MDIQQFRATGFDCADIGRHEPISDECLFGVSGRVYADVLFIEKLASGEWCLTIGNQQTVAPLPELEIALYDYARCEEIVCGAQ